MELSYLGLNNYANRPSQININAQKNIQEYKRLENSLVELGKNEKMLTNIEEIQNAIQKNLENGNLEEGSMQHTHVMKILDHVIEVQLKPNKSLDDIHDFYNSCINCRDLLGRMR